MSTIDIRDEGKNEVIDKVRFANSECVEITKSAVLIDCADEEDHQVIIYDRDIPNLIKALQKVVELKELESESLYDLKP